MIYTIQVRMLFIINILKDNHDNRLWVAAWLIIMCMYVDIEKRRMAGALKKTTGLTGLAVARDPHKTLKVVYEKILSVLHKMPESSVYRKNTQVSCS